MQEKLSQLGSKAGITAGGGAAARCDDENTELKPRPWLESQAPQGDWEYVVLTNGSRGTRR
jgi:hypothetical protein